jgi:hypothetical protein
LIFGIEIVTFPGIVPNPTDSLIVPPIWVSEVPVVISVASRKTLREKYFEPAGRGGLAKPVMVTVTSDTEEGSSSVGQAEKTSTTAIASAANNPKVAYLFINNLQRPLFTADKGYKVSYLTY